MSDASQKHRMNPIARHVKRLRDPASVGNVVTVIVILTFVVVIASGIAMRALDQGEYSSVWEGWWWALQTVTTVGYGDVTPQNTSGRLVATIVMLEGVSFVATVIAAITSTFVMRGRRQSPGEQAVETVADAPIDARLDEMAARLERVESLLLELTRR